MFVILHTCPGELNHQREFCRRIQCENMAQSSVWCLCVFLAFLAISLRRRGMHECVAAVVQCPCSNRYFLKSIESDIVAPVHVWPVKNVWTIDTLHPWRSLLSHFYSIVPDLRSGLQCTHSNPLKSGNNAEKCFIKSSTLYWYLYNFTHCSETAPLRYCYNVSVHTMWSMSWTHRFVWKKIINKCVPQ